MAKTSISDTTNFKSFCINLTKNEKEFENFKRNSIFTEILEHTTFEQGLLYIEEIKKNNKINVELIELLKSNDEQGNPKTYNYELPYGNISPSTLRYIKVLNDLIVNFGNLEGLSIIEIGVGYGGQSKIIQDYFKIEEYNYVDLLEVLELTKKYLSRYKYENLFFLDYNNLPNKKYDILISNYALTECSRDIQNLYMEKIISNCTHGYITGNDIGKYFNIQNYNKNEWLNLIKNSTIIDEAPLTHRDNYVLIF